MIARPGFYKGHGLGNDYLVFETGRSLEASEGTWEVTPAAVRAICDRWKGVGADGIVVLADEGRGGDIRLRMFNPDGSEFERSGNGLRILASHLRRTGRVGDGSFTVTSGGSRIRMRVHGVDERGVHDVSVEMGRARVGAAAVGLEPEDPGGIRVLVHPDRGGVAFLPVSVGNPHAVVLSDEVTDEELRELGPFLSEHPAFIRGTNVQLATVVDPATVRIAIWERGVGRTSASGTSSCAVAVAAVHLNLVEPGTIRVRMEGGELAVRVTRELDVELRGPVQEVATGRLEAGFLASLGEK